MNQRIATLVKQPNAVKSRKSYFSRENGGRDGTAQYEAFVGG